MEDLVEQYREGRRALRELSRSIEKKMELTDDPVDITDLQNDLSLINGMERDMTESISLMLNPKHEMRGESKIILMDPAALTSSLEEDQLLKDQTDQEEPSDEDRARVKVMEELGDLIRERMDLLTNKQKSTLHRWIFDEMTISEIAAADGVSRQSVRERIFGNKTHNGAISKLKNGR